MSGILTYKRERKREEKLESWKNIRYTNKMESTLNRGTGQEKQIRAGTPRADTTTLYKA